MNFLTNAFDFSAIFSNFLTYWYLYLSLFVFLLLFIVACFIKTKERNSLTHTQKLCYVAVLCALCAVLNMFTYFPTNSIAITFTSTICFIAGLLLGAKLGFIVGFAGDLIACIIMPAGAYNPLIGIASGLMGFIPGFIFDKFKGNGYLKIIISFLLSLIVCTMGLNTLGLWIFYAMGKKSFFAYLLVRMPWQALVATGNCIISCALYTVLKAVLPKTRFMLTEIKEKQVLKETGEKRLILASASPRRKEILDREGFTYNVIKSDYIEEETDKEPISLVLDNAFGKAKSVFDGLNDKNGAIVLGADTVVVFGGEIIGKPKSVADAKKTLKALSGKTHTVYTGYAVITANGYIRGVARSEVLFNELTDKTVNEYVSSGKPLDKAGSYGIQDGFDIVKGYRGSLDNIIGLPIENIKEDLNDLLR